MWFFFFLVAIHHCRSQWFRGHKEVFIGAILIWILCVFVGRGESPPPHRPLDSPYFCTPVRKYKNKWLVKPLLIRFCVSVMEAWPEENVSSRNNELKYSRCSKPECGRVERVSRYFTFPSFQGGSALSVASLAVGLQWLLLNDIQTWIRSLNASRSQDELQRLFERDPLDLFHLDVGSDLITSDLRGNFNVSFIRRLSLAPGKLHVLLFLTLSPSPVIIQILHLTRPAWWRVRVRRNN